MTRRPIRVVELFAGVGGFRLALEGNPAESSPAAAVPAAAAESSPATDGSTAAAAESSPAEPGNGNDRRGFKVVWANQWEPPGTAARQFAFNCYTQRFDPRGRHPGQHSNEDIAAVLDRATAGELEIPEHDLLVGGFPCQDYSVAKPLAIASGIEGKKGVLWWEIYRLLGMKRPRYLLLENVDRMLKSPASQRGRDFAIMLSCLAGLGYSVEWRVINAADYGFPQRRRRVYIYAERDCGEWDLRKRLSSFGVMAESFPIKQDESTPAEFSMDPDPYEVTQRFGKGEKVSRFRDAGVMQALRVLTKRTEPDYAGATVTLGEILIDEEEVPEDFFIDDGALKRWRYLKGTKREPRKDRRTGYEYLYSEGGMAFPDHLDRPGRTILTGEGGSSPSRFKHVVMTGSGRYRRLVPQELERLQGFPPGWTDTGMSSINRAFCMGNALVVGIPERIGRVIRRRHREG